MTYRERRLAKAERLREWAGKRKSDANATFKSNEPYTSDIAFNTQPGHIPLRTRIIKQEDRAMGSLAKADSMEQRARAIERAADHAVYSDDENAIERLETRIADNERKRDQMKLINQLYRKGDADGLATLGTSLDRCRERIAVTPWEKQPFAGWALTNIGARIREDKKRIEIIRKQAQRTEAAAVNGDGVLIEKIPSTYSDVVYCRVTFAEKPAREILTALKFAGYRWGGGYWSGDYNKLPEALKVREGTVD